MVEKPWGELIWIWPGGNNARESAIECVVSRFTVHSTVYHRRLPTGMAFAPLAPAERPVTANRSALVLQHATGQNSYTLTTTESTTAAAAATVAAVAAAATTTAVPSHLGKARINVLLGLLENTHEVTSLLSIWRGC